MIGEKLVNNLDKLLNADINNTFKDTMEGDQNMAKLNRDAIREKNAQQEQQHEVQTTTEVTTPEETVTGTETGALTDEELQEKSDSADKLLEDALGALNEYTNSDANNDVTRTENFTGAGQGTAGNEELTAEQLEAKAKAKEDLETRNNKNREYNAFLDKQFSELRQEAGDDQLTPEQVQLQLACRLYGVHEGFLMADGAKPVIKLARAYKSKDKQPVFRKTATANEITAFQMGNKKGYKKGDVVEYDTVLRYSMSGPKTCFGSVISLPLSLNEISLISFQNSDFVLPTTEEIKSSPRVTVGYDQETFFSVLMTYFGGTIKESERVHHTKAPLVTKSFELKGSLVPATVTVNGEPTPVIKKQLKSKSRSSIYVQENIIPYQVYETVDIARADADTKRAITESLAKTLKTDERQSPYSFLDDAAKAAVQANLSGTEVSDVTCALFTGSAIIGQGALKDINLRHWSDSTRLDSGKYEKALVPSQVVKHVYITSKNDPTKSSAKAVKKTLGLDISLAQLGALGYPAAEALAKVGFDEQKIVDLMQAHKADVKQKREARNLMLGKTPKVVARKSAEVDAELTTKLFLNALSGRSTSSKLGIDAKKVQATMLQSSLQ